VAKVSELKERARALEQQGRLNEALAIYRHILNHLERTPAIKHELPLYVKVGDLSLKLGNPTWAVEMYERAAGHYVQAGSAKTIISLCLKIVRVDEARVGVFREYAEQLVQGGQVQAAVAVLQEYARRVKKPEAFVRLQAAVDRPDDEARRGIEEALADLNEQAAPATPATPAAPKPAGGEFITEPTIEARSSEALPAPPTPIPPTVRVQAPATPPAFESPPPPTPPTLEVEPGPFAPPGAERDRARPSGPHRAPERERARPSGPHRVPERERPASPPPPPPLRERPAPHPEPSRAPELARRPAPKVVVGTGPSGGRVFREGERRGSGRVVWIGVAVAAAAVVGALLIAGVIPLGKGSGPGRRGIEPPGTTTVPPAPSAAPAESVAAAESAAAGVGAQAPATQPSAAVRPGAPADTGRAAGPRPDTVAAQPPPVTPPAAERPARPPARVPPPPAPVAVALPAGASVSGLFVVIDGLPIDSVSDVVVDGRPGHRVVQRLPTGDPVVLTAVPVPPGSDSIGLGEPAVLNMFGDVVGSRRYWSYQVNVRASVPEDTVSALLGRLMRARGGS
jgi:hypothetical protein